MIVIDKLFICNVYLPCSGTADRLDICNYVLFNIGLYRERFPDYVCFVGGGGGILTVSLALITNYLIVLMNYV